MVLGRNNYQFRILFSVILTFKKTSKTIYAHYTTQKGYKKQSLSGRRHGIYKSTSSLKIGNYVINGQV